MEREQHCRSRGAGRFYLSLFCLLGQEKLKPRNGREVRTRWRVESEKKTAHLVTGGKEAAMAHIQSPWSGMAEL